MAGLLPGLSLWESEEAEAPQGLRDRAIETWDRRKSMMRRAGGRVQGEESGGVAGRLPTVLRSPLSLVRRRKQDCLCWNVR